MAFFVERPVDVTVLFAGRIAFDMRRGTEVISDEGAQMIGVISRIHDDMADSLETLDQATRLRAVTPLAGGDREPDRQTKGVDSGVDLRSQAAFGTANCGSFKPPF